MDCPQTCGMESDEGWYGLPVEQYPLSNSGDRVLCLVERRQLRLETVVCKGHGVKSQQFLRLVDATGSCHATFLRRSSITRALDKCRNPTKQHYMLLEMRQTIVATKTD